MAVTRTLLLMGTFVAMTAVDESRDLGEETVGRAFDEMERLIRVFDRHRGDTAVSLLNRDGRVSGAPAELVALVARSLSLHSLSEGAFDPTVAPVVDAFSSRAAEGLSLDRSPAEMTDLLSQVGARRLTSHDGRMTLGRQGMAVTLDGIAKGYIADLASAVLSACGAKNHLVNANGDIRACGSRNPGRWP
jgi:thiamine biosynthesis lipoprotein